MSANGAGVPQVSFVVPAIDEGDSIGAVVSGALAEAKKLGFTAEALVMDGGSTDGTVASAQAAGARVVVERGGFAKALRHGIEEARGEYVVVMDGDGSHPLDRLGAIWARRDEADVVIGSRLVHDGGMDLPLYRRLLSRALNTFFQVFLRVPVADSSSGYRLYRAAKVKGLVGRAQGFEFQQEILMQVLRAGGRAVEVPIRYTWREAGASKARVLPLALGYLKMTWLYWSAA